MNKVAHWFACPFSQQKIPNFNTFC